MQLGASLPVGDIGTGPAVIRDYAQTLEGLGFDYIQAPDHVLGGNPEGHKDKKRVGTSTTAYHDPFVLFSFIAGCTDKIGFAPGVLILAQRQAVLVAKQAASLDELSNGRLRLGVGVGWNEVEFTGLNENFHNRGKRSEEQVQVMQALWANQHVDFKGKYHTIDDSGINPRPKSGRVPIWFGGHVDATLERTAKWGDGWMPLAYPADDTALKAFDKLRGLIPRTRVVSRLRMSGSRSGAHLRVMRQSRRVAQRGRVLEAGGRDARDRAHDLRRRTSQADRGQDRGGSPRGGQELSDGGEGSAMI